MRFISSPNWQKGYLVPRLLLLGVATLISFSISASQTTGTEKHSLKVIEIAGISLNTPLETIAKILQAQDYIAPTIPSRNRHKTGAAPSTA